MTEKECPDHLLSEPTWDLTYDHVKRAYSAGYSDGKEQTAQADPLVGFSNLTQAIQEGSRIDWEQLDGRKAQCIHPVLGRLSYRMVRDEGCPTDSPYGWTPGNREECDGIPGWASVFTEAWNGRKGWSLWIEGEIPLKKLTADELEPGTCFRARNEDQGVVAKYSRAQVIERVYDGKNVVLCYDATLRNVINIFSNPEEVEVVEVYGVGHLPDHQRGGSVMSEESYVRLYDLLFPEQGEKPNLDWEKIADRAAKAIETDGEEHTFDSYQLLEDFLEEHEEEEWEIWLLAPVPTKEGEA